MPTSEPKLYTEDEIRHIKEQAVIVAEVGELKSTVPEIFSALKGLTKSIAEIPLQMKECQETVDRDVKQYMHKKFITDVDILELEKRFEDRVDEIAGKISMAMWVVSGFITAGTFFLFLMTHTNIVVS